MTRSLRLLLLAACLLPGLAACGPAGAAALPGQEAVSPTPASGGALHITATSTTAPLAAAFSTATLAPAPSPTLTPMSLACWQAGGRVERQRLEADYLHHPLDFRVYLPPCYDEQPESSYPVLYLFHGQSYTDDQWERLGAGRVADRLVARDEVAPFLIVMPRDREWTPSDEDPLGRAFMELLLPWVDEHYRTLPERSGRAVGGLSRGAGWAVHFGLRNWQEFGAIGAHSPALFWNDGPTTVKLLDSIPVEEMPRIWIDLGARDEKEILESANWFEEQLARRNIPHQWHLFTGYHDEEYWSAHVEQYLRWYAEDW